MFSQKIKLFFSSFWDFPDKTNNVLLDFDCRTTINPENLIKIVGAIFEKIKIFNFFSCELPLILGVGENWKNGSRYLKQDPRYRIRTRSVDWFRLYDRRLTNRQTHTQTFFLKHIFRLWEWCRIKKSKSNFLTIAILPSLLMSLESKKLNKLDYNYVDSMNWRKFD